MYIIQTLHPFNKNVEVATEALASETADNVRMFY